MRTDVSKADMSKAADMCPFLAVLEHSSYWDAVASGMHQLVATMAHLYVRVATMTVAI